MVALLPCNERFSIRSLGKSVQGSSSVVGLREGRGGVMVSGTMVLPFQVDLEPHGRVHVVVELHGTTTHGK